MTLPSSAAPTSPANSLTSLLRRHGGPALPAAFFCAGVSSLMFETLWVRMLTRFFGSNFTATALVLGVFLAGISLGALTGGLFADRTRRPLAVFSGLQVMVALLCSFSSLIAVDIWGHWFVANVALRGMTPGAMLWARISCAAASVGPASFLMGMALPLLVSASSPGLGWQRGFGRLYAWHTLGAVLGALWAGYVYLGWLGESGTVFVAALGNLAAAGLAQVPTPVIRSIEDVKEVQRKRRAGRVPTPLYLPFQRRMALAGLATGGAIFLALQALWTRLLLLPLQTGTYSFSAMMAMSLLGAGLGSWASTRSGLALRRPLTSLGLALAALGALAAMGLGSYGASLRASGAFPEGGGMNVAFWLTFPAAFCFGWLLPTGARACLLYPDAPGEETGRLYTVNTVGAIIGAAIGAALLVPQLGAMRGAQLCCLLAVALGGMVLAVAPREERRRLLWAVPACVVLLVWGLGRAGDPLSQSMTLRTQALLGPDMDIYATLEGPDSLTVVAGSPSDSRNRALIRNGRQVIRPTADEALLAWLPMAITEHPRRILLVNVNTGTSLAAATQWPVPPVGVVAADPAPGIFDALRFFQANATELLALESVAVSPHDGRSHLLLHPQRHDVIAISLTAPIWNGDTVSLVSQNFFELCKDRLNSNGLLALQIPPANPRAVAMILATLSRTFPGISVWQGLETDAILVIAAKRPFKHLEEDLPKITARLALLMQQRGGGASPDAPASSDTPAPLDTAPFAAMLLAREEVLAPLLAPFPTITDRKSRIDFPLQFLGDDGFADPGPHLDAAGLAAAIAAKDLTRLP